MISRRWALIHDPLRQFKTQALLCTEVHATPAFILDCFVQRCQMEGTFEEARAQVGENLASMIGQGKCPTTPCLLTLYFIVKLLAQLLFATGQLSVHGAS